MTNMDIEGRVYFITGASRGIGRAIALELAKLGANIVIAAKTSEPHSKLDGTIYTVAREVEDLGSRALALKVDVRDEEQVSAAFEAAYAEFGVIDGLVNNASAISIANTEQVVMKRFDLMHQVNVRATFMCSKYAVKYLVGSDNPHILNLSPPLSMRDHWFKNHLAYTMSKYGMSMCTLGMSVELAAKKIAVNSLWPKTTIATDAVRVNFPIALQASRQPAIVAEAAAWVLQQKSSDCTGNFFIDEEILSANGCTDFDKYAVNAKIKLMPDLYIDN